ncbi:MAG TPA: branched-chain amino acid transaminase [Blastocatellia bacterium]|nr:branched-chain amino acid transaminase [Blastocatellia bacterium]
MAQETGRMVWHNGQLIPWDQAQIHVMSHVVNYGSSLFEGVRCYKTETGSAIFRLGDHLRRFLNSCHIYRMPMAYTHDELLKVCVDLVEMNAFTDGCYIRPIAFRGYGTFGVNPFPAPVEVYVATWAWGAYLGEEALEAGVDVCVSSWTRLAPNTFPAMAKSGANYMNSQLIKMEAITNGYVEGIALDVEGYVSEGSGENVFIVKHGKVYTPPLGASILPGITRDSIITLCGDLGIPVEQANIPRELLYVADEVFFSGTAAEITPIRSVDRITVGAGRRGPVTERLQRAYLDATAGRSEDVHGWLTPIRHPASAPAEAGS